MPQLLARHKNSVASHWAFTLLSFAATGCGLLLDGKGTPDAGAGTSLPALDPCAARCPGRRCIEGECAAYRDCGELGEKVPGLASGTFDIDPDGADSSSLPPFPAHCEFYEDEGYTLLLKADGRQPTFEYASPLWTNGELLNPESADLSALEAKLQTALVVPIKTLLIGMRLNDEIRWEKLSLPESEESLRALFERADCDATTPVETCLLTNMGRSKWLNLVDGSALQTFCGREGINLISCCASARIGILGNNEQGCGSADSFIGFGGSAFTSCGQRATSRVGNSASCLGEPPQFYDLPTFGYILGR